MRPTHAAYSLSAFAFAFSLPAFAAGDHDHDHDHDHGHDHGHMHSDIEYESEDGVLIVKGPAPTDVFTGQLLFEGDFGDLEGGPNATDDPGFEAHSNDGLTPGSFVALTPVGSLLFWNGIDWSAADAGVTITATGILGDDIISWSAAGNSGGFALISETIGSGIPEPGEETHQHADFEISAGAPVGAYLLSLALVNVGADGGLPNFADLLQTSAPFSIAFNFGLEEAVFEAGVDARVVPVPAAVWLLGTSLAGLASCARQRRGNPA
jgi:hypothetical protein